jgi:hypothetical protein
VNCLISPFDEFTTLDLFEDPICGCHDLLSPETQSVVMARLFNADLSGGWPAGIDTLGPQIAAAGRARLDRVLGQYQTVLTDDLRSRVERVRSHEFLERIAVGLLAFEPNEPLAIDWIIQLGELNRAAIQHIGRCREESP